MLTADQARRCASAANALRPSWSIAQLDAVLGDPRISRFDGTTVARALCWIATDGKIQQPTALFAAGPWWDSAQVSKAEQYAPVYRYPQHDDCHDCGRPKAMHPLTDCAYTAPVRQWSPPPADVKAALKEALKAPPTPTAKEATK